MVPRQVGDEDDNTDEKTFIQDVFCYLRRQAKYATLIVSNPKMYTYEGVRVPLRATPELQRHRRSIYRGLYERAEMETIRYLLRPDDRVLELGAGCGIISAFIAQRLSDSRNLHSFEANPHLLKTINAVASANGVSPNVVNAAVGIKEEKAEFFFDEDCLSSSSYDIGRNATKSMVQVVAISELLERIRPTFIVFDIEGAERDVLTVPLPQEVRVLCGELHPKIIGDHTVSDVVRSIINSGFDFLVDRSDGQAVAFARPE